MGDNTGRGRKSSGRNPDETRNCSQRKSPSVCFLPRILTTYSLTRCSRNVVRRKGVMKTMVTVHSPGIAKSERRTLGHEGDKLLPPVAYSLNRPFPLAAFALIRFIETRAVYSYDACRHAQKVWWNATRFPTYHPPESDAKSPKFRPIAHVRPQSRDRGNHSERDFLVPVGHLSDNPV